MDKVQTRTNTPVSEFLSRFRFGQHRSPAAVKPVLTDKIITSVDSLLAKRPSSPEHSDSYRHDGCHTNIGLSSASLNQQDDHLEICRSSPPQQCILTDSPNLAVGILTVGSIDPEDCQEGSIDKKSPTRSIDVHKGGKGDELLTYKRRARISGEKRKNPDNGEPQSPKKVRDESHSYNGRTGIAGQKRKNSDDGELESPQNESDAETAIATAIDQTSYNSGKVCGNPVIHAEGFGRVETLSMIKTWKRVIGPQKTVAPKRIIGQYFLDLGQSDFSHSTCPTCGLFYARGHENDEKIHKNFHRSVTQGIIFKGWQSERVASRLDDKGNRVIVVLAEDTHHQAKVREVIDLMELELGLTPGWLLQRSCKVYLFISSSKKIVGCLMAEPIKSAFRVVPAQCQSPGKGGEPSHCDVEDKKPSILTTEPQIAPEDQLDKNESELPATQMDDIEKREQNSIEGGKKSDPIVSSDDAMPAASSSFMSSSVATGSSPECKPKVKEVLQNTVKQESLSSRDKTKTPKITDFFALKTRTVGSQAGCKSEWDVSDSKPDIKALHLKVDKESKLNNFTAEHNQQPNCRQPENEEKLSQSYASEAAEDDEKPSVSLRTKTGVQDGDSLDEDSKDGDSKDGDSRERRRNRNNVMIFGNIKFSRETASRKRASKERTQDLGSAILCTKTSVPAVCGVRVIWVSHTERRKGIATHLLDAMRKTFSLGVVLEPSQFAFSQPTPEGRKFAVQYCKTDEFLVYTTS